MRCFYEYKKSSYIRCKRNRQSPRGFMEDNLCKHYYEALGGKRIDTIKIEMGGEEFNELIYGWEHIGSLHSR